MRKFTFLRMMMTLLAIMSSNIFVKAQIVEGFETGLPTSYSLSSSYALSSGSWTGQENGVIRTTNGIKSGTYSCQLRSQTGAQITSPTIATGGISTVTFWGSASTESGALQVKYSIDGGANWTAAAGSPFSLTSGATVQKTATINSNSNNIIVQFYRTGGTVFIDDISINTFKQSCITSNLAFAFSSIDKITTDAPFIITATSDNQTTAIEYSSNNTDVATVNKTTGEVVLVGAGQATISASQTAGNHNTTEYCQATTTYTLNAATNVPTIIVTEVTVPDMNAYVGELDEELIKVSAENLSENILLEITGTDKDMFSLSTNSVSQNGGEVAETTVKIIYKPTAPGSHNAKLTMNSTGATEVSRTLNGYSEWTPLTAPVAIEASSSNSTGFTANWNGVIGATEYQLNVYTKTAGTVIANDLIFSEYLEGSSNNKAIEIYNGTGVTVDLSQYSVELYSNGGTTASNTLSMTGLLQHNDVYVIYKASSVNAIISVGDISSGVAGFNGNDALVLKKGTDIIDSFGKVGTDPGDAWTGNGVTTLDKTLIRKPTVANGRVDATSEFDPSIEWNQKSIDSFNDLGTHLMSGAASIINPITGSPFTLTETSKAITGLNASTTYYYTVTAKNANVSSPISNEEIGATLGTTSLNLLTDPMFITAANGKIKFSAVAGESLDVYNAIGQRLLSQKTVDGLNTITLFTRGVLLIKVGSKITKVIL